jgi:hypothetical protein
MCHWRRTGRAAAPESLTPRSPRRPGAIRSFTVASGRPRLAPCIDTVAGAARVVIPAVAQWQRQWRRSNAASVLT